VVVILDQVEAGFEQTLAQDVIELMTVFSARLYGSRSHKNRRTLQQTPI
jgi:predicted site-specific integrase-resolvase